MVGVVKMNRKMANNNNNNESSQAMSGRIVGAVWVENPGAWWVPAGLEATQGPGAKPIYHRDVHFGAEREWKNDEDGWQVFETRSTRRRRRREARRKSDTYDFDDTY